MKKFGWFSLGLGILSFIGAAANGNSVFGPLFWIGLGAFLLHKSNQKESNSNKHIIENNVNTAIKEQELPNSHEPMISHENEELTVPLTNSENQKSENLEEIPSPLTIEQREAAMYMILIFGGYPTYDIPSLLLIKKARDFFGISDEESTQLTKKYENIDGYNLIDIIHTIKSREATDFLLLTCYELIKPKGDMESYGTLNTVAKKIGYTTGEFVILTEGKVNSEETLRKIAEIEDEVTKKVERILKNRNRGLGFCHIYVNKKKNITGRLWH